VKKIVGEIFDRNLAAWDEDNGTFTAAAVKKPKKRPARKSAKAKPVKKKKRPKKK